MDELYSEVANALDGLVIPPLRDIVNEFLPDRAILSSNNLLTKFDRSDLTVYVNDYGDTSTIQVSGLLWHYATFSGAHPEGTFQRSGRKSKKWTPFGVRIATRRRLFTKETEVIRIF